MMKHTSLGHLLCCNEYSPLYFATNTIYKYQGVNFRLMLSKILFSNTTTQRRCAQSRCRTPRCFEILGKKIGRENRPLAFTQRPQRMKNQQKLKSCLDKIQGFSKIFLDFSDFLKFFIKYKMSGIESYVEKVPKLLKSDECRGT